jgi:hypothetical protein
LTTTTPQGLLRDEGWGSLALRLLAGAVGGGGFAPRESDWLHVEALRDRGIDSLLYLAHEADHSAQRIYQKVWREQVRATDQFASALTRAGIEFLVLKGMPLVHRFYDTPIGCMADVDFLVHRADILRAIPLLYELELRPRVYDAELGTMVFRDVADMAKIEANHYELVGYNRVVPIDLTADELEVFPRLQRHSLRLVDGAACGIVEIDLHHAVASDLTSDEFFERAVETQHGWRTFSDADHLWFGLSRLYAEVSLHGKTGLRDLAYLGPLITRGDVDWSVLLDAASRLELRPGLYYFLHLLNCLSGGKVPDQVLAELDPRLGSRHRDWGWQFGKLFNTVDPAPI